MIEGVRFCEGILSIFEVNAKVENIFGEWVLQPGPTGLVQSPCSSEGAYGRWNLEGRVRESVTRR